MPNWIVAAVVVLGMLVTVAAMIDWLLRLRQRLPRGGAPLVWFAVMLGLPMCDRFAQATGDIRTALPPAVVLVLLSLAGWLDAHRRARRAES